MILSFFVFCLYFATFWINKVFHLLILTYMPCHLYWILHVFMLAAYNCKFKCLNLRSDCRFERSETLWSPFLPERPSQETLTSVQRGTFSSP